MGRTSSITNSFVNGIIPVLKPTDEEILESLEILEQTPETVECVYCGAKMTEWDHLFPLINNKKATGYITEIKNLVPACGKCNQSKGNKLWHEWILSDAPLSPKSKKIKDLERRIKILERYEKWGNLKPYDFEDIIGEELWEKHWDKYKSIIKAMEDSKDIMNEIKRMLSENIKDEVVRNNHKSNIMNIYEPIKTNDRMKSEVKVNYEEDLDKNFVIDFLNKKYSIRLERNDVTFSNINDSSFSWTFDISRERIKQNRYLVLYDNRFSKLNIFYLTEEFINKNIEEFKYNKKKDKFKFIKKVKDGDFVINGVDFSDRLKDIIDMKNI